MTDPRLAELIDDPWFPFRGEIEVKPLDPIEVPEPPRHGEDPSSCRSCTRPDSDFVWVDEHWRLSAYLPTPVPGIVLLNTREHHDSFADLPEERLDELGRLTARIERAALSLPDVARVHVLRYGDGGAHFHLWFMPRPLGRLQMRGSMLPMWLDLLDPVADEEAQRALDRIREALGG